jgi:hypothetical protein
MEEAVSLNNRTHFRIPRKWQWIEWKRCWNNNLGLSMNRRKWRRSRRGKSPRNRRKKREPNTKSTRKLNKDRPIKKRRSPSNLNRNRKRQRKNKRRGSRWLLMRRHRLWWAGDTWTKLIKFWTNWRTDSTLSPFWAMSMRSETEPPITIKW